MRHAPRWRLRFERCRLRRVTDSIPTFRMVAMRSVWRRWPESWGVRTRRRTEHPLRIMRWWPVTLFAVATVLGGGALAMWLLGVWSAIPAGIPEPDRLRLERIRTGLTVAAGLAAGVTLLLTL